MSKHLKRLAAPTTWKQPRKKFVWSVMARSGPHPKDESVPLMVIIRDIMKIADTSKEARNIISRGKVEIDGKVVRDYQRPVGFMDVIAVKELGAYKRVLLNRKGLMVLADIQPDSAGWKLVKVTGKKIIKGGRVQMATHDGRVLLTQSTGIRRGDTLKISIPDEKVLEIYPLAKDTAIYVTGGSHMGTITTIRDVNVSRSYQENTVESVDNFMTTISNVFVLGKSRADIVIPGGE
ncbi:MAG: 30S ribosomal protein S4e [Thermoplasmatales archaeon]